MIKFKHKYMNISKIFLVIILLPLCIINTIKAQKQVIVTDQTIKLYAQKEEKLYYGFAKGDRITFSLLVEDNNYLSEVEVLEYPNNIKFSDINIKKINVKNITSTKDGVYEFRLKNLAPTSRVCKLKIVRIPENDATRLFNSTIGWQAHQTTIHKSITKDIVIGYDTTFIQTKKLQLTKTELHEDIIIDKTERVSATNIIGNKNKKTIVINLPHNEITTYKTKKIVACVYWIGVGKEANEAWKKNVSICKNLASGAATILGGGPLAGFAIGTVASFAMPSIGEDVAYWLIPDYKNSQLFVNGKTFMQFDKGKGIAAYGKNTRITQGNFYIGLLNDNKLQDIDVNVKISIIWETSNFEDRTSIEKNITPRLEKKTFIESIIQTDTIPINCN